MKGRIQSQWRTFKIVGLVAAGASLVTPALAANYTWTVGGLYDSADVSPSAPSELLSGDVLTITDGGYFQSSGGLSTNAGSTVTWTGGNIGLSSGAVVNNAGLWNANSATAVSLYDAGYGGTFTNASGGVLKSSGAGELSIDASGGLSFANNGGTITAATGASIFFNSGSVSQATFGDGSTYSGSGQIIIGGAGATFSGTQTFAAGSNVNFSAGYFENLAAAAPGATLSGNSTWSGGQFYGGYWTLAAGSTLTAITTPGGNTKYLTSANFTNNGAIDWTTTDDVYLASSSTLTNNGTFLISAATTVADGSYGGTFVNNGTFVNTGGGTVNVNASGSLTFQNASGGVITASKATDSIVFNSGSYGQLTFADNSLFKGAGIINIAGDGATFTGAQNIASTTNFIFSSGYFLSSGSGTSLNGNVNWTGGSFDTGTWTLPKTYTLTANTTPGGNTKYLTDVNFTNNGSIDWTTADDVYLASGSTLTNNGTFLITAATTVADGSYGGTFVNNGSFVNTGGGTVNVNASGSLTFQNASGGVITATQGSDSIVFNSGNYQQLTFANNSIFNGAGTINIAGDGATFTGAQNIASGTNFVLSAGYFVPGTGGATLNGIANWTGGQFYGGAWTLSSGSTLNVATTVGGNTKQFAGTAFTNSGTINWASADNIAVASGSTITNNGSFNVSQDASFVDGGYGGTLVNNGVLSKTGGTGTTSVAATGSFGGLVNNGVTQVNSGTIALGSTFTNPGTLAGTATFSAGTLTNTGHVSPGFYKGAPASLALTGNYVQSASGFLDVGATGTTNSIFNVSGTASLSGTVDVTCLGTCNYTKGQELLILTSTGLSGTFANVEQSGFNGTNDFSLLQVGNSEYLVLDSNVTAAVPEPSTYALILAGFGLLVFAARRRRLVAVA